jgi:hypothetical protein
VPLLGQRGQLRPAGIRQAHQLGGLVEGLAGGVVQGFAQQPVAPMASTATSWVCPPDTSRATNGACGRVVLHQRGQQVAFHVVHAMAGTSSAQASDRATPAPTSSAPTRPGPAV